MITMFASLISRDMAGRVAGGGWKAPSTTTREGEMFRSTLGSSFLRKLRPSFRGSRGMGSSAPLRPPSSPFEVPLLPPRPFHWSLLLPHMPDFILWTSLTSLAFNLLILRRASKAERDISSAQISVLEDLLQRFEVNAAQGLSEDDLERELEMVGLRERKQSTSDAGEIEWSEVAFGTKRAKEVERIEAEAEAKRRSDASKLGQRTVEQDEETLARWATGELPPRCVPFVALLTSIICVS